MRSSIPALLVLLPPGLAAGQTPGPISTGDLTARLDTLETKLPELMVQGNVPGVSIAVVADGEIAWSRGFGVGSNEGKPVDADTVFEAASLSKPVFAYAAMQMADAGRIDLDRPLAGYLVHEDVEHDPRSRLITGRQVLSHTAGFRNRRPAFGAVEIINDPGTKFQYSGEGYVYLQKVIEEITGVPLAAHMQAAVFEPLGMTRSSFVYDERVDANMANGHRANGVTVIKRKPTSGNAAWSLHTTANDFARFLVAVMDGEGLSESAHADMLTAQVEVAPGVTWGLGWGLEETGLGTGFWHWGQNQGYRSFTVFCPERKVGVIYFANSNNGMLLLETVVRATVGGETHPALQHLGYESIDSPAYIVRTALARTVLEEGARAGIGLYHSLKTEQPASAFDEYLLNAIGYMLLRNGRVAEAIEIFELNIDEYPEAWNPYDSLGEAYMVDGRLSLAIRFYRRSVDINPDNANGTRMLERLYREIDAGFIDL